MITTSRWLLLIAVGLLWSLAACQQTPTNIPISASSAANNAATATVDFRTATIAAQQTAYEQINIAQTARAAEVQQATASAPTPQAAPTSQPEQQPPQVTAIAEPVDLFAFPWMPSHFDRTLPTGAVAQLGIGRIEDVSLSPNGEFLVANVNGTAYMFQAVTLRRMWQARHAGLVTWLGDGKRVGIGSVIYDVITGAELASLPLDASRVAWSPDGALASTHDAGGLMVMWNVAAGQQIWSVPRPEYIRQHPGTGYAGWTVEMRFSPDGEMIATGYDWGLGDVGAVDTHAHIFDADTGGLVLEFESGQVSRPQLTWSPNSRYLAAGSYYDLGLIVWDIQTNKMLIQIQQNSTIPVAWSPDGCRFATGQYGRVTIWDCQTGDSSASFSIREVGFSNLSWSRDGTRLAAGSDRIPYIAVWDIVSEELIHSIEQGGALIGFGTDNNTIIGGLGMQNSLAVWSLDVPSPSQPTTYLRGLSGVSSLAWSPDGSRIISAAGAHYGQRSTVIGWDVPTATANFDTEGSSFIDWIEGDNDHLSIDWSVDGLVALCTASDYRENPKITVIDMESQTILYQLNNVLGYRAMFSPDGSTLAIIGPSLIQLKDARSGEAITGYGTDRHLTDLAWSPDGTQLAIASVEEDDLFYNAEDTGRVDVFDVASGEVLYALSGMEGPALSVAWSPDGTRIAASNNVDVAIWQTGAAKAAPDLWLRSLIVRPEFARPGFTEIAWSPDGAMIAGAYGLPVTRWYCNGCGFGAPGMVLVWDAFTAERVYRFEAHTAEVQTVAFSPDSSMLASGSLDGIILLWDVSR